MSLINDALKRANQAQKKTPHAADTNATLQPVAGGTGSPSKSHLPLIIGIVLALIGISFFFWKGGNKKEEVATNVPKPPDIIDTPSPTPAAPAPQPVHSPVPNLTPVVRPVPPPVNEIPQKAPPATAPLVNAAAPPAKTVVPEAAVPAPIPVSVVATPPQATEIKLQGIFFRLKNPTALISGENVGVGDEVMGAKVKKIERTSVTLVISGEEKVFKLR